MVAVSVPDTVPVTTYTVKCTEVLASFLLELSLGLDGTVDWERGGRVLISHSLHEGNTGVGDNTAQEGWCPTMQGGKPIFLQVSSA